MTDLLRNASDWLGSMFLEHASSPVVYSRGSDKVELRATIGRTQWDVANERGVVERVESRDFIVEASHLALSEGETLPARDDTIREMIGSTTYVYQVMASAPGVDCWEYADPFRRRLRIHTKLAGTET